jgi:medium-chain acyl-[acyl-carrier-protein] hydrolase
MARLRLFCFAHAGAGASAYHGWARPLAGVAELCAVQYPGREWRLEERPASRLMDLVEGIADAMRPELALPYALFGHSMGAVVAFEVARLLRARGAPAPRRLFVSARRPPRLPEPRARLTPLDDAAFLEEVRRRYGGTLDEVAAHPELLAILLPILRADIGALEAHASPDAPPLDCPIEALHARGDLTAPRDEMAAWAEETTAGCAVTAFDGDHFYVQGARDQVLALVRARLS